MFAIESNPRGVSVVLDEYIEYCYTDYTLLIICFVLADLSIPETTRVARPCTHSCRAPDLPSSLRPRTGANKLWRT